MTFAEFTQQTSQIFHTGLPYMVVSLIFIISVILHFIAVYMIWKMLRQINNNVCLFNNNVRRWKSTHKIVKSLNKEEIKYPR